MTRERLLTATVAWLRRGSRSIKGAPQGGVGVDLQQVMKLLDVGNPGLRTSMRKLRQIRQRWRSEVE